LFKTAVQGCPEFVEIVLCKFFRVLVTRLDKNDVSHFSLTAVC